MVLLLGGSAPALLAHETDDATVELQPSAVAPGGGVEVIAHGLPVGERLRLLIASTSARAALGEHEVDPAGHIERTIRLPSDLGPGIYDVRVVGDDIEVLGILVIDPAAGPGVPVDDGLPAPIVALLTVMVAVGLLAVLRRTGSVPKSGAGAHRPGRSGHGAVGPPP